MDHRREGRRRENSALRAAWDASYVGSSHRELLNEIRGCRKRFDDYEPFVCVVQSSWTGKSRIIREIANSIFVIPLSLGNRPTRRPHDIDISEVVYPPPDYGILRWLLDPKVGRAFDRCCAFVQALFQHTLLVLKRDFAEPCALGMDALLKSFNERMHEASGNEFADYRRDFYHDVLVYAIALLRVKHVSSGIIHVNVSL